MRKNGPVVNKIRTEPHTEPLYARVRAELVRGLSSGELTPGMALPAENVLAREMSVSVGTVRKAVDSLVAEGVLTRHQGKGTFVTEQTPERANFHFFRVVDSEGARVLPETLREGVTLRPAGNQAARRLKLEPGVPVVRIERVRAIGGRPSILEVIDVPADLMPGLETESPLPNALYPHYQADHGVSVVSTEDRLSAVVAKPKTSKALCVPEGSPLLRADRVALDLTGNPVEWRRSWFLTDDLAYAVTLG